jgi:hypothetical protein
MPTILKVTIIDDKGNTFLDREDTVGNVAEAAYALKHMGEWFADDVLSFPKAYGLSFGPVNPMKYSDDGRTLVYANPIPKD